MLRTARNMLRKSQNDQAASIAAARVPVAERKSRAAALDKFADELAVLGTRGIAEGLVQIDEAEAFAVIARAISLRAVKLRLLGTM